MVLTSIAGLLDEEIKMADTCQQLQQRGGFWEDQLVNRCKFPIGPINTWTNLAYFIAALFVWPYGLPGHEFAGLLVLLGIGSFSYHGWKTVPVDRLDNSGMYLVYGGLAVYVIAPTNPLTLFLMPVVGAILAFRLVYIVQPDIVENIVMGLFIAIILFMEVWKGHPIAALISAVILGLSYTLWLMDENKSPLLKRLGLSHCGHGLWHVGTATATAILFIERGIVPK